VGEGVIDGAHTFGCRVARDRCRLAPRPARCLSIGLITLLTANRGGEDALAAKKRGKRPGPPSPKRKQGMGTVLLPQGSVGARGACQGRRYPPGHNPDASTSLLCWTSDDVERQIAT
jgi:hypothetical protein